MTLRRPRTIQIFLPQGEPSGIRIAEITSSIMRCIEVPRKHINDFLSMNESKQVGLYFLISGETKEQLYVGQSGDVGNRLRQHHKNTNKDWDRALILVSMTNNLTQTHALYLESLAIEQAKACQRYELLNQNDGQNTYTPVPLKADCDEMHAIGSLLLTTLGYPIFENLTQASNAEKQVFVCRRSQVFGRAFYTNEGMVVLKGSSAPFNTKRKKEPRALEQRDLMLEKKVIRKEGDRFVFQRDYLFKTPSGASCFLLLGSSNGWMDWKTEQGVTLHDHVGRDANDCVSGLPCNNQRI